MPATEPFQRLPTNVKPKNYQVSLQPDLVKCSFKGCAEIEIEIIKSTSHIVLNALELIIGAVTINANEKTYEASEIILSSEKELLELKFPEELQVGLALLSIKFEGTLNDKLRGFYRTKYSVGSEMRYGAVTQFEATDARRCFPCWDEPAVKATFDVILIVPKNRVALSNMNEISRSSYPMDESLHVIKFAKTPIMSTYLVAVVVGEYDFVSQVLPSRIEIRIYTPIGKKEQGNFALEVASKVLPYYTKYFEVDYPLPKMDLIAIPDFAIGAMENWGLITYRETCLLVDPHNSSAGQKQKIALVVGHEIAHQWFGNLVTMEWWTHLWLNEGYATFGEFLCIDNLYPNYDIWTQFVTRTYTSALELDALRNSHPVEVPVGHPSEVDEIFDDISYNKGASIIRMIHNFIGDEDFRKGMNIYLNRHKFENTTTKDLWAALSESSGKPITQVMSNWTEKTGFPMIVVTSKQDGQNRILTLNQRRFLADGSADENQCEWIIPVSIITSKKPLTAENVLLESKSTQVVLDGVSGDDWVKINVNLVGYYRTLYPAEMLEQLRCAISSKTLPPLDRLGVIDDLFAMVSSGHSSTVDVLRFLKSYEDETYYTVWASIHNIIYQLNNLISHTSYQPLFRAYVRKLLTKIFTKLGWEPKPNEGHLDTLLRSLVLLRLGMYGEESVIDEATRRLTAHLSGTALVAADLRSAVYKTVMSQASESTFEQMLELYRKADLNEEEVRISTSLGATRDPNLIQKVLHFAMSDEVRSQDTVFVILSITHSSPGRDAAWAFLKSNLQQLINKYEGGDLLARLIKGVTENFASEEMAVEVEEFFKNKFIPGTERTVQQAVECIRLNALWLKRDSVDIEKFLKEET